MSMKNTALYVAELVIEGAELEGDNPLPVFRNRKHNRDVKENGTLSDEQKHLLGYEAGERYLPYRMQDLYSRNRKTLRQKSIVLENDVLEAVFLPEYGGRLYSLKNKQTGLDVFYKNPVFQPANLAILNAWFSGGVEWNVGQLGHTFATSSSVYAAQLTDDEGNPFLRLYEYERCKNVFWHIDFHLPPGADMLQIYVRILNDNETSVPMYWWTNVAVRETEQARVFSSTSDVIYMDPRFGGFGAEQLPELPSVPGEDVTFPMRFPFANEYFFQTPESVASPWEAVAYEDGRMFYERSTSLLRYRKMFCWGNHAGGRRWCDFLANPGEGNYIEVQGGFAPTQLHGLDMPGRTEWDFTQLMGEASIDPELACSSGWEEASAYVQRSVDSLLNEQEVYRIHERLQQLANREPQALLHQGSGWGALEKLRRETLEGRSIPAGLPFGGMGQTQVDWVALLQDGSLPVREAAAVPDSWMVQDEWQELLEASLKAESNRSWNAYLHLGVMLYEKGLEEAAVSAWETSLQLEPSVWVYRNLAEVYKRKESFDKARSYMEQAYELSGEVPERAIVEEYLNLLIQAKDYQQAWSVYAALPESLTNSDRIQIIVGAAALELDQDAFMQALFQKEFAVIREGEVLIIELWYKYNAKQLARARNVEVTDSILEEAKVQFPPPKNIDFRVVGW
ncbi:DUF5107 domain-containing protein [Paenibacillus koleovorans]|uniref:DUF5107 domain-containing protein n=1 Tax=Paenibacillus koleovorans TaxID=121608 RepID=UPI000FDC8418|nr:DUF5107 domain-containing protein [Paenibacillus koleovorans]